MSNPLDKALGIAPIETPKAEILPPAKIEEPERTGTLEPDAQEDYNLSRETFHNLIKTGNSAIESLDELAKLSENPRAYEVLANLLKTVSETTKDLYDLQKKTKELKQLDAPGRKVLDNGNVNIDKAVFVGTTTDLLKSLKDQENNG